MAELVVDVREEMSAVVVDMRGSLDLHAYETVRVALVERLRADDRDLLLELDGVDYIDSTGLRLLVELAAIATRDRRRCVIVMAADHPCRRVFSITKTDEVLDIVSDAATARADLSARALRGGLATE